MPITVHYFLRKNLTPIHNIPKNLPNNINISQISPIILYIHHKMHPFTRQKVDSPALSSLPVPFPSCFPRRSSTMAFLGKMTLWKAEKPWKMGKTYGKLLFYSFTDDVQIFQKRVQYGLKTREHGQYVGEQWWNMWISMEFCCRSWTFELTWGWSPCTELAFACCKMDGTSFLALVLHVFLKTKEANQHGTKELNWNDSINDWWLEQVLYHKWCCTI
jgi:hypothetical protein